MAAAEPLSRRLPLLKRLLPSLQKRWARLFWHGGFKVVRRRQAYFLVRQQNYVDRRIAFGGHEEAQLERLLAALRRTRCDLFLDVGANIGLYAVLVAREGLARRVVALEPDPRSLAQLHANLLLNDLVGKVEVVAKAASAAAGTLPFVAAPATTTGQSRIAAAADARPVEAIPLDALLRDGERTVFAKIDVEGHERQVIAGMPALLRRRAFLQVECFPPALPALAHDLAAAGLASRGSIGDDHFFANFEA